MTYKFHLNADLKEVWKRLAEKHDAGVAQVEERLIRTQQGGASNASIGPKVPFGADDLTEVS